MQFKNGRNVYHLLGFSEIFLVPVHALYSSYGARPPAKFEATSSQGLKGIW